MFSPDGSRIVLHIYWPPQVIVIDSDTGNTIGSYKDDKGYFHDCSTTMTVDNDNNIYILGCTFHSTTILAPNVGNPLIFKIPNDNTVNSF